jgi:hypothetical protein
LGADFRIPNGIFVSEFALTFWRLGRFRWAPKEFGIGVSALSAMYCSGSEPHRNRMTHVRFGSKADVSAAVAIVRFVPLFTRGRPNAEMRRDFTHDCDGATEK